MSLFATLLLAAVLITNAAGQLLFKAASVRADHEVLLLTGRRWRSAHCFGQA